MDQLRLHVGTVDLASGVLRRDEQHVELSEREIEVLRYLAAHAHRDVPREDLLVEVWRVAATQNTRAVDTAMRRLRVKIERDPANPEHLITVHGVGYRLVPLAAPTAEDPPVAAPAPARLPVEDTPLVGREALLDTLVAAVGDGARLVTLTGPPGIGKTRLAHALGRAVADRFPGGVHEVPLATVRTLPGVLLALGAALGVPLTERGELEELVERFGDAIAGRGRLLLILDNVEQIVDLAAGTVGPWLEAAPQIVVVVTSRSRLQIPPETVFAVEPLPEREAVALFVDRAARVRAGYRPSAAERAQIAEIARRLDGLPLAIELAAARTGVLGPRQILDRLASRFRLLSGRGQALRASIDQSWELLDPPLRRALTCASVFAGGFDGAAAAAVIGPDAARLLAELGRRSLVTRREVGGGTRYDLLESLRVYAEEQLDALRAAGDDGAAGAVARHAAHYLAVGESLRAHLEEHGGIERLDRLQRDLDNLLVAHRRALGTDPATAARLAHVALAVLHVRGPFGLALELLDAVLARPLPPEVEVRTRVDRAYLERRLGRFDAAQADFDRAIEVAEALGDGELVATARGNLANLLIERGEPDRAEVLMREALAYHRDHGDTRSAAVVLGDLAVACKQQGRRDEARALYQEALDLHREVGNRIGEGLVLGNLAILQAEAGRAGDAESLLLESLAIHREIGNRRPEAVTLANLGQLVEQRGDLEAAERYLAESLRLNREMGHRRLVAIVLGNLAEIDVRRNRLGSAETRLDEAIGLAAEIGHRLDEASLRAVLAGVRWRQGRLREAEVCYREALERFSGTVGGERGAATTRAWLAALVATRGELEQAEAELARAADVLGPGAVLVDVLGGVADVVRAERSAGEERDRWLARARERSVRSAGSTEPDVGRAREVLESTLELQAQGLLRSQGHR